MWQRLSKLVLIAVLLVNMFTPAFAYASVTNAAVGTETVTEPTVTATPSTGGDSNTLVDHASLTTLGNDKNIISVVGSDSNLKGRVNKAITYNEQVHYLMTYTVLKGTFLESSGYADLYKTGEAATGADQDIAGLNVQMGYSSILETGSAASNPHKEEELEAEKSEEVSNNVTLEDATTSLANAIADKLAIQYVRKYHVPENKISVGKKLDSASIILADGLYDSATEGGLTSEEDAKKIVTAMKKDATQKLIHKGIADKVKSKLMTGNFDGAFHSDNISHTVADAYKRAGTGIKSIAVESNYFVGAGTATLITEGSVKFSTKASSKEEAKKYLSLYPSKTGESVLNARLEAMFSPIFEKSAKKYKTSILETEKYKTWESLQNNREEAESQGQQEAVDGNVGGLAWIPLDIYTVNILNDTYDSLIASFDGGKYRDGNVYVSTNGAEGRRAVQINDFVAIKREGEASRKPTASPYFTYDYEKKGNTGVATANVGETGMVLGLNLGLYAGMKTINLSAWDKLVGGLKGIFGQNDYGIATPLTANEIMANSKQLYPHKYISMLNTNQDKIKTITDQADYTMGIDNYGNIISGSTLQVLVPYWHNTEVSHYKDFNTSSSYFISTPVFQEALSEDVAKVMKSAKGTPRESSDIKIDTFQVDKTKYASFLSSVKGFKGDSIGTFPAQVQGNVTNVQGLALSIVSQTKSKVKAYNETFVKGAFDAGELYMSSTDGGRMNSSTEGDLASKFNAADLLERIKLILDYGFYEIIRLTIVSWVVSFYTGTVSNFSMSSVFHTTLITESAVWQELLPSIAKLLGAFVGVYILFLGFRVIRNTLPLKGLLVQFVTLSSVIIVPLVFYAPLIDFTLNKPTEWIVGTQMEQVSILDNYIYTDKESREMDDTYALLFGSTEDIRDRSQDYLVTFYTTTHVDGFLTTEVTEQDLTSKNRLRSVEAMESGKWRAQDLVKVRVSIFHLFEWVEADSGDTLFNWLSAHYPNEYGLLTDYAEYATTAGDNIGVSEVKYTASELYMKIFNHSEDVMAHIEGLYSVSTAFRNKDNELDSMKITDSDREALVRDLALPVNMREQIYGSSDTLSPAATSLWTRYGGGLALPATDFLNLTGIVNELVPKRDHFASELEANLYDINREVIDNYIINYSIVRESIGSSNTYTNSEFHIIVMDTWFKLNEVLDIHNAPVTYSADSVSFDNYMRLVFIPMKEYADLNNKGLENVGQFISLRTHPSTLLFTFLPALVLLMVFGLTYIITFYVFMMILITVSFIWNYVIKNNMQNKSWLGALVIISSFAIAKLGLLVLWKFMAYFMNLSAGTKAVVAYPYVLLHSLLITVYLAIALYLLFTKVFKSVLQDKSNLGGELFSQGISNLVSGLKSTFGGGGGKGGRGNRSGLRDGMGGKNSVGSSVKNAMNSEGREGKIPVDKNPFTKNGLDKLTQSEGKGANGSISQDIDDLNFAIHNEESVGSGHEFAVRFADTTNEVNRELAYQQGEKYDTIETGRAGLSQDQINYLNANEGVGNIVATNHNGTDITTIDALTESNAKILAGELENAGIKAVADGTTVAFNSTGVELADAGVRKRIFGGILPQLLDDTHKVSALSEYEADTHNYSIQEDGRVVMGVGSDGIAPETLDKFLKSPDVSSNFIVEETPVKRDGKYLQGNVVLVPKTNDREHTIDQVNELFEVVDTKLRQENKVSERHATERQVVEFMDEELAFVYQNLQGDLQVQKIDGKNVVTYDVKDELQTQAVHELKSALYRDRDIKQEEQSDLMHRTVAYINEGGDNGFYTETRNTSESKGLNSYAKGNGLASHLSEIKMFGGVESEAIVERATKIKNLVQANPEALDSYAVHRDSLYRYGEQLLAGRNDDQEAVLKSIVDYAQKNKVAVNQVKEVVQRHEANILSRKNANMSERDFVNATDALVGELQISLQETGVYDKFMSDVIRNAATKTKSSELKEQHSKVLNDYVDSKVLLNKADIDVTLFELYSERDFDKLSSYLDSVTNIQVNEDETVTIESRNELDTAKMKAMTELLLTQAK